MKAIVRERYGSADVLEVREVEVPRPADGEVLLRVRAAGLDRGAGHIMAGVPYVMRLAGFGVRRPKNMGDVSGVVEQVGSGVTGRPTKSPGVRGRFRRLAAGIGDVSEEAARRESPARLRL